MPSRWIVNQKDPVLSEFRWNGKEKSSFTAALMLYMVIVHHANDEPVRGLPAIGCAKLSFTDLAEITGISRAKISAGLNILEAHRLIERIDVGKTNIYRLLNYDLTAGWAKLPAKKLYDRSLRNIEAFRLFHLRRKGELNALKLYLLLVAFRSNRTNYTVLSYEKIHAYTGISRNDIRSASSLLITMGYIQVEKGESPQQPGKSLNIYRVTGIEPFRHSGTMSQDERTDIFGRELVNEKQQTPAR